MSAATVSFCCIVCYWHVGVVYSFAVFFSFVFYPWAMCVIMCICLRHTTTSTTNKSWHRKHFFGVYKIKIETRALSRSHITFTKLWSVYDKTFCVLLNSIFFFKFYIRISWCVAFLNFRFNTLHAFQIVRICVTEVPTIASFIRLYHIITTRITEQKNQIKGWAK